MYRRLRDYEDEVDALTRVETVKMEQQWMELVAALKECWEELEKAANLKTECINLLTHLKRSDKLQKQIEERRKHLPNHIPDRFILIKQPLPSGGNFDTHIMLMCASLPSHRPTEDPPYVWRYTDYSTHPIRHVRPFANLCERAGEKQVYAVIAADTRRRVPAIREYCPGRYAHGLVYDWAVPINWNIDLFNYSVVQGPYSDQCAYEIFHRCGGLMCLRWNKTYERHEDTKLVRVVQGRMLLHLMAPYGKLLEA